MAALGRGTAPVELALAPVFDSLRPMSTLTEIESAVTALPREEQAELLRFVAAHLRGTETAVAKTGAELARLWPRLPHLAPDEASAFARDLAEARTTEGGQAAPPWE